MTSSAERTSAEHEGKQATARIIVLERILGRNGVRELARTSCRIRLSFPALPLAIHTAARTSGTANSIRWTTSTRLLDVSVGGEGGAKSEGWRWHEEEKKRAGGGWVRREEGGVIGGWDARENPN